MTECAADKKLMPMKMKVFSTLPVRLVDDSVTTEITDETNDDNVEQTNKKHIFKMFIYSLKL